MLLYKGHASLFSCNFFFCYKELLPMTNDPVIMRKKKQLNISSPTVYNPYIQNVHQCGLRF